MKRPSTFLKSHKLKDFNGTKVSTPRKYNSSSGFNIFFFFLSNLGFLKRIWKENESLNHSL